MTCSLSELMSAGWCPAEMRATTGPHPQKPKPITTMETKTNTTIYRVSVELHDWDSRGSYFKVCGTETLRLCADLAVAKAAFAEAWAAREEHASANQCPVNIALEQAVVEHDPEEVPVLDYLAGTDNLEWETYSGEPAPNGDQSWHCYYGGQDCTGWYVLWAHNLVGSSYRGRKYDANCLGVIGRSQANHCGTGEWELRHMDDSSGALYADELHPTREGMLAAIAEIDDLRDNQGILEELSNREEPVVQAERSHTPDLTEAHAILPDGEEFTTTVDDDEAHTYYAFSYDQDARKDVLVRIELPEVEEEETENA